MLTACLLMQQPDSKFQCIQTDICLLVLPTFGKVGGTKKNFSLAPLANHVLYLPLLESRRRPCRSAPGSHVVGL